MSALRLRRELRDAAPVFAALGDETRLSLLTRLASGEAVSITRLAVGAPVTRQAVTKHLHVLERAGVVRASRRGREQLWQLEPRQLAEARRCLDIISRQWDEALNRLRKLVEDGPPR